MNFTRAQKEAIWRKIEEASSIKKNKLLTEFEKNWKPNPKFKDLCDKLKKADKLRKEADAIMFEITGNTYSKKYDFGDTSVVIFRNDSYDDVIKSYKERALKDFEDKLYADKVIPDETTVMDELELQLLSKSFDVQAFLAKFGVGESE